MAVVSAVPVVSTVMAVVSAVPMVPAMMRVMVSTVMAMPAAVMSPMASTAVMVTAPMPMPVGLAPVVAVAPVVTAMPAGDSPPVPAGRAAPTDPVLPGIAAPIPARAIPPVRVPAIAPAFEHELGGFDGLEVVDRRTDRPRRAEWRRQRVPARQRSRGKDDRRGDGRERKLPHCSLQVSFVGPRRGPAFAFGRPRAQHTPAWGTEAEFIGHSVEGGDGSRFKYPAERYGMLDRFRAGRRARQNGENAQQKAQRAAWRGRQG
jgi:hypothetical protein